MKIEYVRDVQEPGYKAGQKGKVKDLPESVARDLIRTGHAKPLDEAGGGPNVSADDQGGIDHGSIE